MFNDNTNISLFYRGGEGCIVILEDDIEIARTKINRANDFKEIKIPANFINGKHALYIKYIGDSLIDLLEIAF